MPGREFQWKMAVFRDPELEVLGERLAAPSTFAGRGPAQCGACPNRQRESDADRSLATCEPCKAGFGAPAPPLSTVCAQCAAGKEAPSDGALCADCADGFMSEPDDTVSCTKCP